MTATPNHPTNRRIFSLNIDVIQRFQASDLTSAIFRWIGTQRAEILVWAVIDAGSHERTAIGSAGDQGQIMGLVRFRSILYWLRTHRHCTGATPGISQARSFDRRPHLMD